MIRITIKSSFVGKKNIYRYRCRNHPNIYVDFMGASLREDGGPICFKELGVDVPHEIYIKIMESQTDWIEPEDYIAEEADNPDSFPARDPMYQFNWSQITVLSKEIESR